MALCKTLVKVFDISVDKSDPDRWFVLFSLDGDGGMNSFNMTICETEYYTSDPEGWLNSYFHFLYERRKSLSPQKKVENTHGAL